MDGLDDIVEEFLVESHENLDQLDADLVTLEKEPASRELLSSVFRTIHTIKGTSGFLAFHRMEELTHAGEDMLSRLRDGELELTPVRTSVLLRMVDTIRTLLTSIETTGTEGAVEVSGVAAEVRAAMAPPSADVEPVPASAPPEPPPAAVAPAPPAGVLRSADATVAPAAAAATDLEPVDGGHDVLDGGTGPSRRGVVDGTVRVDVDLLDRLMALAGELVLSRNRIVQCVGRQTDTDLLRASQRLNVIVGELQEGVMKTRMQPIDQIFAKLPRLVRDLGLQCDRQVRLEMEGRDTELDRTLLEAIKDPLTHLVRNSVDHGIEAPEVRTAAGKPAEGLLLLRARHDSGQVIVEVTDDGAGIDLARLGATALDLGLVTADALARMSPTDVLRLIFLPGFSTQAAVTHVSGRGVGMDVVKTNIEAIGGTIEVESVPGEGTVCRLSIPLTLTIVPALTVDCAGDRYAIPQVALQELVALDVTKAVSAVEDIGGVPVYRLRGELLPLVRLAELLAMPAGVEQGPVVIAVLRSEGRRFGLVVDRVINTEEIVVKAVGSHLKAVGLYSGAAVLGDGTVALILDIQALARRALRCDTSEPRALQEARIEAPDPQTDRRRVLLAAVGGGRRVAIPLGTVTRLEQVPSATVEKVGNREVVQYLGAILPLVRLDRHLGVHGGGAPKEVLDVIVYADHGRSVAIVVEEILDIFDGDATADSDIDDLGLLGSAVLDQKVTELLDVRAAILAADPAFFSSPTGAAGTPASPPLALTEV